MLVALGLGAAAYSQIARLEKAETTDLFSCPNPEHHDGDAIRCGSQGKSMRLYAIDAPEMPGACRPGRQCTPGDPFCFSRSSARPDVRESGRVSATRYRSLWAQSRAVLRWQG